VSRIEERSKVLTWQWPEKLRWCSHSSYRLQK